MAVRRENDVREGVRCCCSPLCKSVVAVIEPLALRVIDGKFLQYEFCSSMKPALKFTQDAIHTIRRREKCMNPRPGLDADVVAALSRTHGRGAPFRATNPPVFWSP